MSQAVETTLNITPGADVSPSQGGQGRKLIQIARFEFCLKQHCPLRPAARSHLLISKHEISLDQASSSAVALSYAWGKFQHSERIIGHDTAGEGVFLTLGAEWDTEEITNTLVRLSVNHGGCWIDQLCIGQEEEKIRETLASIPLIYKSLEVVVLMPGSPCKCLSESLETINIACQFGSEEDTNAAIQSQKEALLKCHNFIPSCSWFQRAWTRQEMFYSKRISVAWSKDTSSPCVAHELPVLSLNFQKYMNPDQVDQLSVYSRLLHHAAFKEQYDAVFDLTDSNVNAVWNAFRDGTAQGALHAYMGVVDSFSRTLFSVSQLTPDTKAGKKILQVAEDTREKVESIGQRYKHNSAVAADHVVIGDHAVFIYDVFDAFREYLGVIDADGQCDDIVVPSVLRFFAGETMFNAANDNVVGSLDEATKLTRFLKQLGRLRTSRRSCSKPRDYINSIWVDCPGFRVPQQYKSMGLPEMLDNALGQLRTNFHVSVITTVPGGLFGAMHSTALWNPSVYLEEEQIKEAKHVYGTMVHPFLSMPVTDEGMVPLQLTGTGLTALSADAADYESQMSQQPTSTMCTEMSRVMSLWPDNVLDRLDHFDPSNEAEKHLEPNAQLGLNLAKLVPVYIWKRVSGEIPGSATGNHGSDPAQESEGLSEASTAVTLPHAAMVKFRMKLLENARKAKRKEPILPWDDPVEADHAIVVYVTVAEVIGLDYEICRRKGLRLMISRDPPCIGLASTDFQRLRQHKTSVKTVCVSTGANFSGVTMYEVVEVRGTRPQLYRVFGAWVPLGVQFQDRVYAVARKEGTDAFIV